MVKLLGAENVIARQEGDFPVDRSFSSTFYGRCSKPNRFYFSFINPFLEHDDANRALMGSNMMRQAVPIVTP